MIMVNDDNVDQVEAGVQDNLVFRLSHDDDDDNDDDHYDDNDDDDDHHDVLGQIQLTLAAVLLTPLVAIPRWSQTVAN